jgi:hypothetical protein
MITITLRRHPDDADMIELRGKTSTGATIVWGVVHSDIVYEDELLRKRLDHDEVDVCLAFKP